MVHSPNFIVLNQKLIYNQYPIDGTYTGGIGSRLCQLALAWEEGGIGRWDDEYFTSPFDSEPDNNHSMQEIT